MPPRGSLKLSLTPCAASAADDHTELARLRTTVRVLLRQTPWEGEQEEEEEEEEEEEKEEQGELPTSLLARRQRVKRLLGELVNLLVV
ncbi:hypothetical protein K458DRAFT_386604 [Lentithecium fluviatile CBS 122367]|uniref:Uncharacterized protein n=1 Tax=Lentithecium fluviatile CBS 122367 TaxID=1168545 RepID=A0A6G1J8V5_9PLEO|nr:hypothetical protein K458DRAFT_386604 [Lentithecium fluviatile CBS 122367]